MTRYQGTLVGKDLHIHQTLTATRCLVNKFHCVPSEQNKGAIVWKSPHHISNVYHTLGIFKVHRVSNFYLIGRLCIGGGGKNQGNTKLHIVR